MILTGCIVVLYTTNRAAKAGLRLNGRITAVASRTSELIELT